MAIIHIALNIPVGARKAVNTYLEAALGNSLELPNIEEIEQHRQNFLDRFGPERLVGMNGSELLHEIPLAGSKDSMDYWLEFKQDEQHNGRLFGSVSGGSAAKFGVFKSREGWKAASRLVAKQNTLISEDEAIEILQTRRTEMLAAVEVLRGFEAVPPEEIKAAAFQAAIVNAAPTWRGSGWFHKYLHLNFPDLITWGCKEAWLEAQLYSVGIVPPDDGIYALDLEIIRFWNSLPILDDLPIQIRYRAMGGGFKPRDHWYIKIEDHDPTWREMVENDYLSFGPKDVANLSKDKQWRSTKNIYGASSVHKTHIESIVDQAFIDAGMSIHSDEADNLTNLLYYPWEGTLITLLSSDSTIVAIGESKGSYYYEDNAERPHRLPVQWHLVGFRTSSPFSLGPDIGVLNKLKPRDSIVADIEGSLLIVNNSHRPDKSQLMPPMKQAPSDTQPNKATPSVEPSPPSGIERRVADMLDRKGQVILYGPPGTGKTYFAKRTALELVARRNFNCLPEQLTDNQEQSVYGDDKGSEPYLAICTFHPMYSYEDFVEGYRPDQNSFTLETGIFKQMAEAASKQPNQCFILIIDEINRGNIPKVFGELIMLIEKSKRGETSSYLPLSKERFTVPDNLLLIGTMNTADRSILLLDTALRRRFAFMELLPEPKLLHTGAIGDVSLDTWLHALNRRVVENLGRDGRNLQIGHAYLMPEGKVVTRPKDIGEIFHDDIWPLLQEYCYEDPKKLLGILGSRLYDEDKADLRHDLFEPGHEDDLTKALESLVDAEDTMHETDEDSFLTDGEIDEGDLDGEDKGA